MKGRPILVTVCAVAFLVGAGVAGAKFGAMPIPLKDIIGILAHGAGLPVEPHWPAWQATVVLDIRLPRIVVAICVGASLALSGAALQGLFRNPLADPGVLGVSSGASVGAVLAMYVGVAARSPWAVPVMAFIGATATAFLVYAIATRRGQATIGTLLLAGIAVGSLNAALTSFIISLALANYQIGQQTVFWLMGGLDGRTWDHVRIVAPGTLLGAAVIVAHARDLDALLLGETHAVSVGVDVPRVRRTVLFAASLMIGLAVAVSGIITFVGLVIPHMLRLVMGPRHGWLLPLSMVVGGGFLVATDLLARTLIAPEEIRLGIITACVGAPFFLYLLMTRRREHLS